MRARALMTLIAAVVLMAGLAACGDDEEPTITAGDETVTEPSDPQTEETTQTVPAEPSGGESEQNGNGQQPTPTTSDPEDALQDALVSGDPQLACEEAVTEEYVSEAYGSAQGCRSAQGGGAVAEQVTLVEFEVDDTRASGVVRFEGGTYDGEEGDVELVLEGDAWRLDSLQVDVPPGP